VNLFVDTSVWSLAFRRGRLPTEPAIDRLYQALDTGEGVFSTGLVRQELLQGFAGPKARAAILGLAIATTISRRPSSAMTAGEPVSRSGPSTRCWRDSACGTTS
jgi:predicted nucleic acid-binding protein